MVHKNTRICNHLLPAILTALANVQFRGYVTAVTVTVKETNYFDAVTVILFVITTVINYLIAKVINCSN